MRNILLGALLLASLPLSAMAQGPQMSPEVAAELAAFRNTMETSPDLPGTGRYPAIKRVDSRFPDHVIYRPADLGRMGRQRLPIVLWGNGGCARDGASGRHHLLEIASHGYLAIAPGPIMSGPGSPPPEKRPVPAPFDPGNRPPPETVWQDVLAGLDLAIKANADPVSPYYQRLDTTQVAVAGHSCGGLQALNVAMADKRVKTVILHNSGIFIKSPFPIPDAMPKSALTKITQTILYLLGGPADIAYENGMDDYRRLSGVPAAVANIGRGHQATFAETNGGAVAQVAVDWLDWRLKHDVIAARRFTGKNCGLCSDHEWTYQHKGM